MFADKTGDEPSATHFSAIFESTEGKKEFAPLGQHRFACQQLAEDDSVAVEQHAAGSFHRRYVIARGFSVHDGPAAGAVPWTLAATICVGLPWSDQGSQIIKAISCHHARGHQLPQSGLNFCLQFAGATHDIGKERRASGLQVNEDGLRHIT